jgi:deoxyribodipyrimidine photolyase-related protein
MRHLVLVLGDQLMHDHPSLKNLDTQLDGVLMIEAASEGTQVWSHKSRISLFLSAMRHFAQSLRAKQVPLSYHALPAQHLPFAQCLAQALQLHRPQKLVCMQPGEWRMLELIREVCEAAKVPLEILEDPHFLCSLSEFAAWAAPAKSGKAGASAKQLRMEFFYRMMRKRHGVLMQGDEPEGGVWNLDADNREPYPKTGPGDIAAPASFAPDEISCEVMAMVERLFPDHPGGGDWQTNFIWPVTRQQALQALDRFIEARLHRFGPHQDAMWTNTPFGWHALLSTSLNLHLLNPREVISAVMAAYRENALPLASVEGFIRQVLGWREFIRGVYWLDMPHMSEANHFNHQRNLPAWYWTGNTQMACMRDAIGQTLSYGFAHHIQRLMVTGQFALLAEVKPQQVSDWYLAVYVDAVEWVELPNVMGMALYAQGPRMTSKPYIASGQYIKRQSNYCKGCRYDPALRTGARACPISSLYWRFLDKHEHSLAANPRTSLMAKSVQRLSAEQRAAIREYSDHLLDNLDEI